MSKVSLKCDKCQVNTGKIMEMYMVHDELWDKATPNKERVLCIGCLEERLGRHLTPKDFKLNLPINKGCFGMSIRLADRLGYTWNDLLKLGKTI